MIIAIGNRIGRKSSGSSWTPRVPTGLTATVISDVQIDLAWTNIDTKGDGVSIERSLDNITFTEIATVALGVSTYSNTGLTENTTYYYRVKSYKGAKYSDPSVVASGKTIWSSFVMTFDTELGGSATKTVVIPTYSNGYNCVVNWGDGSKDVYVGGTLNTAGTITHIYATTGIKTISISGIFPQIYFNNGGDKLKLKTIAHWGTGVWRQMNASFYGCANMIGNYSDVPDTAAVTNMAYMFYSCIAFKQSLATFSITSVTDFTEFASSCNINTTGTATNYDATLIAWNLQVPKPSISINFGTSKYTAGGAASAARAALIADHTWTITDGGTL